MTAQQSAINKFKRSRHALKQLKSLLAIAYNLFKQVMFQLSERL